MTSSVKRRLADGQLRFGLMWFNSQTPYLTSAVAAQSNPPVLDVNTQMVLARAAENAGFDFLFLADTYVGHGEHNARIGHAEPRLYSPVWSAVLATATKHIGIASTLHTKYLPPAVIARMGANLDVVSGGRWAWNVVPGTLDDAIVGMESLNHAERYAQATEAVRAVKALWVARGEPVEFEGDYHTFSGRLIGPHPVQKPWPLLFNAGVSPAGQQLIASECDYGFFTLVDDLDKVRAPVENIARIAENAGRDPREVNLIGTVAIVIGESTAAAQDRFAELRDSIDMDAARAWATNFLGRSQTYKDTHGDAEFDAAARSVGVASGAKVLLGTPGDIAEQILSIYRETGLRGYQITPLTWSEKEVLQCGEIFEHLERAGVWTPPHKRGFSW
ncbi:LLM class flavin-dependent oxidoreductase [Mycobacterium sp. 21AC1]|uniref:LLM class flavin-dependent oxidoreductase n=1 Tax=[Mycobacterium] appelbergii TaxID=2939269 RepID=UPI0029392349|nr:LLM class flavin-dependent oxidoreductase [Mycobacterium sp. 21AC1]MDV3129901.1 LLM class flavin-dependent oxidoreductase [Mycobacterium sp. 21AC1]